MVNWQNGQPYWSGPSLMGSSCKQNEENGNFRQKKKKIKFKVVVKIFWKNWCKSVYYYFLRIISTVHVFFYNGFLFQISALNRPGFSTRQKMTL